MNILNFLFQTLNSTWPSIGIEQQPHAKQPYKTDIIRPIEWGEINFIHTTDTHGWFAGHLLEHQFSADWGDLITFVDVMRENAESMGVDLLIVDSGDRHDGNGLSDKSVPDSSLSLPIFCELDYDLVTIGNHELYRGESSYQEFYNVRPVYGERYLVSNVDILIDGNWVPMGAKYRLFTTKFGKRVLAFGFVFDFNMNDKSATQVYKVGDEIKQPWFQKTMMMLNAVDHIVLVNHIPVRNSLETPQIINEIRKHHASIPISVLGGHSHVRDSVSYDDMAFGLQSGRYGESVGWLSFNSTNANGEKFKRRYIDCNLRSYQTHGDYTSSQSSESSPALSLTHGQQVSKRIAEVREYLNLDEKCAYVPTTYYVDRRPYPSDDNIYTLLETHVLPQLTSPEHLHKGTRFVYLNTGAIRFDLFKGYFTTDSAYIVSPFKNEWNYIDNVPLDIAEQIIYILNQEDKVLDLSIKGIYTQRQSQSQESMNGEPSSKSKQPSFGYVTCDDLDCHGDDTKHSPWVFHPIPNVIQSVQSFSTVPTESKSATLVFHDFMAAFITNALSTLEFKEYEIRPHGGETLSTLIPQYFKSLDIN